MLESRHVHVQIQPIDPFDLQPHPLGQNLGPRPCYAHPRLRSSGGLHRPSDRLPVIMPGAIVPIPPVSRDRSPPLHGGLLRRACLVGLRRSLVRCWVLGEGGWSAPLAPSTHHPTPAYWA